MLALWCLGSTSRLDSTRQGEAARPQDTAMQDNQQDNQGDNEEFVQEFVQEFLVESSENLDQLDRDLVALEDCPDDAERLASIFRTVHTIKGTSGFFGFSKLGALTHSGEHLLGRLRDGTLELTDEIAGTLLSMVDAVRTILRTIEETGGEGAADFRELSDAIASMAESAPTAGELTIERLTPAVETSVESDTQAAPSTPAPAAVKTPVQHQRQAAATADTATGPPAAGGASTVRVDVGLLGSILDLVGELVLARNQLRLVTADQSDPRLQDAVRRIHAVTGGLQETSMKTRMQPISQVFSRMPRVVRDLAASCGKEVRLAVDGADTELDRSLVESIRDPLTHLIRNAVDHGIEPPADRLSAGKPREGRLSLRAFHESGQVCIEIEDDGRGIPIEAIREKAIARGLLAPEAAETASDEAVLQCIFEPGFSTAAVVTDVSGRGVGMDVVKRNIESIGGTVDLRSSPGRGTTIRVRIPLTLAIIPALIVTCGSERLAIPQASVCELVPLDRAAGCSEQQAAGERRGVVIEGLDGAAVIRLRGSLLPVVNLRDLLGLPPADRSDRGGTVVRVRVDDHEFGLVVDCLHSAGDAEAAGLTTIVVKPVGSLVSPLGLYAGSTVMGDGGVTLILDLRGIARAAEIPARLRRVREEPSVPEMPPGSGEITRLVLCRSRSGRRLAVPVADVSRLERFRVDQLEQTGRGTVVRHHDGYLRLVDIEDCLDGHTRPLEQRDTHVIVAGGPEGLRGLVVDEILDIDTTSVPASGREQDTPIVSLGGAAAEMVTFAGDCAAPAAGEEPSQPTLTQRYSTFTVAGRRFAVAADHVAEVLHEGPVNPVPRGPRDLLGLLNLRGRILPVVDMRQRLGFGDEPPADNRGMIVVCHAGDSCSLLVDEIGDVIDIPEYAVEPVVAQRASRASEAATAIHAAAGELVYLLDLPQVVRPSARPRLPSTPAPIPQENDA